MVSAFSSHARAGSAEGLMCPPQEVERVFAEESPDWNLDLDGSVDCELCSEEKATMHLLRVVDGAVTHTHLCPDCAQSIAEQTDGLALVLAVPSVFRRLTQGADEIVAPETPVSQGEDKFCGVCGTTLTDFRESGLVGCPNCYRLFADELRIGLESEAQPVEHLGKMPRRGPENDSVRNEMMRLERMLSELVACERFEEAAGVRDRLAELGQELEGEPS
jgi:protein arginine kinase activator